MIKFKNNVPELISQLIDSREIHKETLEFHLLNTFNLGLCEKEAAYKELLEDPSDKNINLPDGWPVAFWLSILKRNHVKQIRGSDLLRYLIINGKDNSHFLLGSTENTLLALQKNLHKLNPAVKISGFYSPPFVDNYQEWLPDFIKFLKEQKIDFLWIGLGTPKQDYIVRIIRDSNLNIKAVFAVGAAFDFLAETKMEVPLIMKKMRLEWFHRLLSEPKRLWKRYTVYQLYFMKAVLKSSFK
jgi:N-acetylglucosaminyldiphosphoundecaprenol N-acetyl-beta-D-mannosaminyltransferase